MKIGVLTPTRGDRPKFLEFAFHQIKRQTVQPNFIELVDDVPVNPNVKDITFRYAKGSERLLKKGADVIFLIEDDDYYSVNYIETMLNEWNKAENPEIFGSGISYYYHLALKRYCYIKHYERASAFSTMITKEGLLKMKWPKDDYPFTDIELWKQLKGKTFVPDNILTIGIKGHNEGKLFGGIGHNREWMSKYEKDENWLEKNVDNEAFEFYSTIV